MAEPTPGPEGFPADAASPPARWRVERATGELDRMVDDANAERERRLVYNRGPVEGELDACGERRRNRMGMLTEILTPSDDELARARDTGDHTLLEQAHAAARLTDRLPAPLHRAAQGAAMQQHVAAQTEVLLARRMADLNAAAARAKADPGSQTARQARELAKQRTDTRAQIDALRAIQRDLEAVGAAAEQRTEQLRNLDLRHHRTLARGAAALTTLGERGYPTQQRPFGLLDLTTGEVRPIAGFEGVVWDTDKGTIRRGPWDGTIVQPSRSEEAPHTLGGANTVEALRAENAKDRDGRPDLARREQAVRDRAQLAELARQLDPAPAPAPATAERTRQPGGGRAGRRQARPSHRDRHGTHQRARQGERDRGNRRRRGDDGGRER